MIKALGLEINQQMIDHFGNLLTQKLQREHKQGAEIPVMHMYIQSELPKQLLTILVSRNAWPICS